MDCINRVGCVTILGLALIAGCNKGASSDAATAQNGQASDAAPDAIAKAAAQAAADFVDAVIKGDGQRASARLTPQAMERIIASGLPFSPPGLSSATYRMGEVRAPSQDQAVVQCVLTDNSEGGTPHDEEMCCLLRRVENDWRVSGIAYGVAPDKPWTLSDFETGKSTTIARQPMTPTASTAATTTAPGGRPSPPRTAQETPPTDLR